MSTAASSSATWYVSTFWWRSRSGSPNSSGGYDDRWYAMADGTERYLVDEAMLMQVTKELGAELVYPIKTSVVQNLRSMTTWVLRK